MAKNSSGVWGIEIGQTALKAMHCVLEGDEVVVDAFDFVEYPNILSQPDADPQQLVSDAIKQLLDRNDSIHQHVVMSVPGQSGLSKFFKPPPVEVKKLGELVKYEARQQIPFDLEDVVWDYKLMPGSLIEEGFAADSEVGLFAMKREQAYRQLQPFDDAEIEVDQVQLAPIALYNMLAYDRLHERLEADMFDPSNPPPNLVLLSIGTDSSDLIITNGFRIWQRNMPIGGNHFTRQLAKDLKMTFAKAEHLKRNVREAADPKLVIQTMRPVFSDLETEIQRSIGFFKSIDKTAEIGGMVITGNTVKMPGLAAYLGKNLGFDVEVLDRFNRLGGGEVMQIPTFRDNIPTYAVCYGLCLQGLGKAEIDASLIPQEIKTERMIRSKKPWTVAALAALLLGMSFHYGMTEKSWETTHETLWKDAEAKVTQASSYSGDHKDEDAKLAKQLEYLDKLGAAVAGDDSRRLKWLELMRVVNGLIPRPDFPDGVVKGPKELPLGERKDIHVTKVDTRFFEDLGKWWTAPLKQRYVDEIRNWAELTGNPVPEDLDLSTGGGSSKRSRRPFVIDGRIGAGRAGGADGGPEGEGWVVELTCYHDYNNPELKGFVESDHIRRTLLNEFLTRTIDVPVGTDADGNPINETFTLEQFGIAFPILLEDNRAVEISVPNPDFDPAATATAGNRTGRPPRGFGNRTPAADGDGEAIEPPMLKVRRLEFVFQFVWQERTLEERIEARAKDEAEAEAASEASPGVALNTAN